MMFNDVNDAGKRAQKLIDEQVEPGLIELRALIRNLNDGVTDLRLTMQALRNGLSGKITGVKVSDE